MKIYWGLCILLGIVKKPTIVMYWSTNKYLHTPVFSKRMIRKIFQLLSRYLHFATNEAADPDDKLSKLRKFYNMTTISFSNVAEPGEVVSIDEALIRFFCRISFKTYNASKPAKLVSKHINSVMRKGTPTNSICIQE